MGVVLKDDLGYSHCALIVCVEAEQVCLEVAILHYPQRGEYHRDAECDESQAADGGDELVSAAVAVGGLPTVELGVEVGGLVSGQAETDVRAAAEDGVEVAEFLAESLEIFVEGGVGAATEDIVPDESEVEDIEDEAADSVIDAAAALAECFCKGEAEVAPVGVAGGDVGGGRFDSLRDGFDVILQ